MTNITLRNIPNEIMEQIRILSILEKRSLNNELLILIEKGLVNKKNSTKQNNIGKSAQTDIWKNLCGKWEDKRTTKKIINDIISKRTTGREVKL